VREEDLLARVDALRPLIEAHADEAERAAGYEPEVVRAIAAAGLFKLLVPQEYGGLEAPLPLAARVFAAVAEIDGAAGWTVMIGAGGGPFAAYQPDATAREVFGPRDAVVAGSGAPDGLARRVPGGYRVSGTWRWASGAPHATWFTANCRIDGGPEIRAMTVPAADVQVVETWDAVGLRATASHDMRIEDVLVPEERTFALDPAELRIRRPLYRYPFVALAGVTMASVALGVALHALRAFAELARTKRTPDGGLLRADPAAAERYAAALSGVRAAQAWFERTLEETWAVVAGGGELDEDGLADVALACAQVARSGVEAADRLVDVAGMAPVPRTSALGRCWRDLHTLRQNVLVNPARVFPATGSELLARDRER
jgi:alkylation response protein AidB-like acyl-CoA dehydrogenase